MKWTNVHDLPNPLCLAIEQQRAAYTKGDADFSVTELIDSPLISVLKKAHAETLVDDYADNLWSLFGSLAHSVIQNAGSALNGTHVERMIFATFNGIKVKGQVDHLFIGDRLDDYKLTSAWAIVDGVVKPEWEAQENLYLHILRHSPDPLDNEIAGHITKLNIVGMCRDWGPRMKAKMPTQIKLMPVRVWTPDEASAYMLERIRLHVAARDAYKASGTFPPACTDDERWASPAVFAVMKKGRKSSLANLPTMAEAEAWKRSEGKGEYIEQRPAVYRRCQDYCLLSKNGVCPHYHRTAGTDEGEE